MCISTSGCLENFLLKVLLYNSKFLLLYPVSLAPCGFYGIYVKPFFSAKPFYRIHKRVLKFYLFHSLSTALKTTSMCVHFSNPLPLLCTFEVRACSPFEVICISNILFGFRFCAQKNVSNVQSLIQDLLLSKLCWISSS